MSKFTNKYIGRYMSILGKFSFKGSRSFSKIRSRSRSKKELIYDPVPLK